MSAQRRSVQSLDGMVPVEPPRKPQRSRSVRITHDSPPLAGAAPRRMMSLQPRSLDGLSAAPRPQPVKGGTSAKPATPPPTAKHQPLYFDSVSETDVVLRLPRGRSLRTRLSSLLQYIAVALIALLSAYSTGIGQWFVLIYALIVLVLRRSSSLSFGIALFVLVSIPVFQLLNQPGVANNMAVYVYELLVVGTLQAVIELKWPARDSA